MKIVIIGARGYLGRELARLLIGHPHVDTVIPASTTKSGAPLAGSVPAFTGHPDLRLVDVNDPAARDADVVFLATAGGEARSLMPELDSRGPKLVVDLSRDHRLEAIAGAGRWTYGLPECEPGTPRGATHVANPGCYPTASTLSLAPAISAGFVAPGTIIVDGKSGVSGAGATPRPELHYAEMHDALRAYKVLGHDHEAEIESVCRRADSGATPDAEHARHPIQFTPHLVPTSRGLLTTAYAPLIDGPTPGDVQAAYDEAYQARPFVTRVTEAATKDVLHSNRAHVAIDINPRTNVLVARGAIDNLVKGGAGAAVQNLNLALGLPEEAGLPTIGATA